MENRFPAGPSFLNGQGRLKIQTAAFFVARCPDSGSQGEFFADRALSQVFLVLQRKAGRESNPSVPYGTRDLQTWNCNPGHR
jgi:hypothetical protein